MKLWLVIAIILAGVVVIFLTLILLRYHRDIRVAHKRIKVIRNQFIETACGPVEYATLGKVILCSWCME